MNNTLFSDVNRQQMQQSYMDLHSLQDIRNNNGGDKESGLRQVAQQFESMFIQMMLKSMRSANDVFAKDNPLNSFESDYYRDMYDNQLSLSLSGKNLGLADALYQQLKRNYLNNPDSITDKDKISAYPVNINSSVSQGSYSRPEKHHIPQRIKDASLLNGIENYS